MVIVKLTNSVLSYTKVLSWVIGTLKDVITPGSTDVFVIDGKNGKEIMVVAIDSNIKEINMEQRLIKAVLPEWVE